MEMEVKQRAWILLSFVVSGFEFGVEEMRFWKRNLGLVSSSRNSISLSDGKVQGRRRRGRRRSRKSFLLGINLEIFSQLHSIAINGHIFTNLNKSYVLV